MSVLVTCDCCGKRALKWHTAKDNFRASLNRSNWPEDRALHTATGFSEVCTHCYSLLEKSVVIDRDDRWKRMNAARDKAADIVAAEIEEEARPLILAAVAKLQGDKS